MSERKRIRTPGIEDSPAVDIDAEVRVHDARADVPDEDLDRSLRELIAWHEPKAMAIEEVFFGKNVRSAMAVGQASGVAMLAAAEHDVDCFAYTPQAIKMAVCGSGAAMTSGTRTGACKDRVLSKTGRFSTMPGARWRATPI